MKTFQSLAEQLVSQAKALEARGTSAVARARENGGALVRRLGRARGDLDLGKLTPANLRAAAVDAAEAFAGHFRAAGAGPTEAAPEGSAAPAP